MLSSTVCLLELRGLTKGTLMYQCTCLSKLRQDFPLVQHSLLATLASSGRSNVPGVAGRRGTFYTSETMSTPDQ